MDQTSETLHQPDEVKDIKDNLTDNRMPEQRNVSDAKSEQKISKKQLKRMQKHEMWIANKAERKKKEKEKRKAKMAKKLESGEKVISRNQLRKQMVKQSDSPCKVTIVIDCDYAEFMNEMELKKLCKQLNRCYSSNKHSTKPVQLYITSITGAVKDAVEKYQQGYCNWDAHCTEKHWSEVFGGEGNQAGLNANIVYLSGDSAESVPDCSHIQQTNNGIFIIGGLIDHNRYKGLALERAQKYSVKHGQLPIGEHIRMTQRRILAIPHVFDIMLYAANGTIGQSWNDIFQKVIPSRKLENENGLCNSNDSPK